MIFRVPLELPLPSLFIIYIDFFLKDYSVELPHVLLVSLCLGKCEACPCKVILEDPVIRLQGLGLRSSITELVLGDHILSDSISELILSARDLSSSITELVLGACDLDLNVRLKAIYVNDNGRCI